MNLNRVIEQMRDRKMIANLRNTITILGCMALIVFGCAQNKGYESSPIKPNTNSLALAGNFRDVVVDDLNGDGHLDVIGGASSPGMVTINYGDGRGGISETQVLPVNGDVQSVAVADFNEDGLNDVVFSVQRISTGIRIWLNQSKRKWKDLKGPIEINNYQSVKTADVNGDGHMDIIAANTTSEAQGGIQVWLGDGKGGWLGESGPTVTGMYMDVAIVDLNGDAALDLIGAGWGTHGALRVWFFDRGRMGDSWRLARLVRRWCRKLVVRLSGEQRQFLRYSHRRYKPRWQAGYFCRVLQIRDTYSFRRRPGWF
jgi:hypothetical protein